MPFVTSDTLARLKIGGFVSEMSDEHMCYVCPAPFCSLVDPSGFDRQSFGYRDPDKQLKRKFTAKTATEDAREHIAEKYGVRYSILDSQPGWHGASCLPPELMHLIFLCKYCYIALLTLDLQLTKISGDAPAVHKDIMITGGMFNGTRKRGVATPTQLLETFIAGIEWPGSSGRISPKIAAGRGRPKADEWRNLMRVYPVALANISRQDDANEDDYMESADLRSSRNYHDHYTNVLRFCAGIRILITQSITPNEAERGQTFFTQAFESWATMNCHLKPSQHTSTHILEFLMSLGPAYAWWVFAYERFIGILGKMNTNGKRGGEMEATVMRGWWELILCQELVSGVAMVDFRS
ncbi:hypothetical protein PLICRDRAFT_98402 [Plicaturopsis crispa FD-325 SS-3]|nr:hypothetical protein PLICRDRAFT_98402 [Plicaturopsis crispa FD-325 SS-3]